MEGVCKQIGTDAFFGCSNLESIDIDSYDGFIGEAAFYGCANLQSVTIPSYQDIIYTSTFSGCKKLTNIVVPDFVKEIRSSAFYGCASLESLTIGKGINKTLGNSIVGGCSNLQKLYIRNTDTFYYATQNTFNYNIYEGCTLYVPKGYSTVGSWGVDWNYFKNFENIVENHFSLDENTDIDINISSAEWSTMILPFDAEIPSGMNVYSCSNSSDNILTLEPVSNIKANTPYLINGESGTYSFSAIGSAWEDLYIDGWFTGAYVEAKVPENSYILAKVNGLIGFYKVTGANVGNTKIAPYHCYLTVYSYSSAKSNALYFDDATTNITNINGDTTTAQKTRYNLSGQRIDNNVKGLVIENGKKIIVK